MTMKNAMDALGQEIRKDVLSNEVMDGFECQWAFESELLRKRGGEVHPQTPGAFEFDIHSYVNPCSEKMGVHERYFHTRLRHTDNFVGLPHLVRALEEGLHRAIDRVLTTNIAYEAHAQFQSTLTTTGDGGCARVNGDVVDCAWMLSFKPWQMPSAATNNLKWMTVSITHVRQARGGSGRVRKLKPSHQHSETFIRIQNRDVLCCVRACGHGQSKGKRTSSMAVFLTKKPRKPNKPMAFWCMRVRGVHFVWFSRIPP